MKVLYKILLLLLITTSAQAQFRNNYLRTKLDEDNNWCIEDADSDGVSDCFDKCPDTPEGTTVDTHGCMKDTDGDGVLDFYDKQFLTPTECQPSDANGIGMCPCNCPQTPFPMCGGIHLNTRYIYFKTEAILYDFAIQELMDVAERMRANPSFKLVIEIAFINNETLTLNTKRAKAIIDYVTNVQHIDRDRFMFLKTTIGDVNTVIIRKPKDYETGNTISN